MSQWYWYLFGKVGMQRWTNLKWVFPFLRQEGKAYLMTRYRKYICMTKTQTDYEVCPISELFWGYEQKITPACWYLPFDFRVNFHELWAMHENANEFSHRNNDRRAEIICVLFSFKTDICWRSKYPLERDICQQRKVMTHSPWRRTLLVAESLGSHPYTPVSNTTGSISLSTNTHINTRLKTGHTCTNSSITTCLCFVGTRVVQQFIRIHFKH